VIVIYILQQTLYYSFLFNCIVSYLFFIYIRVVHHFFTQQATVPLRALVACGVSLSNAAHASQSPQSNTPGPSQSGTSHWVSWLHAYINLLTVIAHAQQLQSDIVHG